MTETAQALMAVYNFNLFADDYVAKYREEREHRWHSRLSINDEKRYMVHLEPVRQISHSSPALVCMGNHNDLVAAVNKLLDTMLATYLNSIPH